MASSWVILFSILAIFVVRTLLKVVKAFKLLQGCPGPRTFTLADHSFGDFLIPCIPGVSLGLNHNFVDKHYTFAESEWDIVSNVSVFPQTSANIFVVEVNVIKEITAPRAPFVKGVHRYEILKLFGPNIIASEGEDWRKYRKISAPAFSEANNRLVWDETVRIMEDLFANAWDGQNSITVDQCVDLTLPIALFVISAAGFGQRISWQDDAHKPVPHNHKMKFKEALHIVATKSMQLLQLPGWALSTTKELRKAKLALKELTLYMSEMIKERQSHDGERGQDLFSNLMSANGEDKDLKLSDQELMGNIYIFLIAGHETTAHTLTFCFGLLALYPEEQEILYEHIKSVVPTGQNPTYNDIPRLTQSMAVFYETLRMFSPAPTIPKISTEDTTLVIESIHGEKKTIPVQKDTELIISVLGLHYNPRYWKDPHSFKPSRFLEDWPRDAFVPFSLGNRACLGRKFFETEGIAILTMMVSKFKIEIKDEPQFRGETFEAKRERVLKTKLGLTVTPVRVPLVFKRRTEV